MSWWLKYLTLNDKEMDSNLFYFVYLGSISSFYTRSSTVGRVSKPPRCFKISWPFRHVLNKFHAFFLYEYLFEWFMLCEVIKYYVLFSSIFKHIKNKINEVQSTSRNIQLIITLSSVTRSCVGLCQGIGWTSDKIT